MRDLKLLVLFSCLFFLLGCVQPSNNTDNNIVSPPPVGGKTVEVQIKNLTFVPAVLEISKGDTVKWTNLDSMAHTATSSGNFDTGVLQPGKSGSITFNNSGSFDYICTIHPSMNGNIKVN